MESLLEKLQAAEAAAVAARKERDEAREEVAAVRAESRGTEVKSTSAVPKAAEAEPVGAGVSSSKESERCLASKQAAEESGSEEDANDYLKMKTLSSRNAAAVIQDAAADTRPGNALTNHASKTESCAPVEANASEAKKDANWDAVADALVGLGEDSRGQKYSPEKDSKHSSSNDGSGDELDSDGIADLLSMN